jgi:hypothetical protein
MNTVTGNQYEEALIEFLVDNDVNAKIKVDKIVKCDFSGIHEISGGPAYIGIDACVPNEVTVSVIGATIVISHYRRGMIATWDIADPASFDKTLTTILKVILDNLGDYAA